MTQNTFSCTPEFPLIEGWQGADAAYSIPLPDGRVVWIFGDTLYGDRRVVNNGLPRMVHNSIGVSTCNNGVWEIHYTVKQSEEGAPTSYFNSPEADKYFWAMDGIFYQNELWVTLAAIQNVQPSEATGGFNFRNCGSSLARVSNLEADPQNWEVTIYPVVSDGVDAYPYSSTVIDGDYLYIFTLYQASQQSTILTRIPLEKLNSPAENLQYLTVDSKWEAGLNPKNALSVMPRGTSEMSVRYHPDLKQWVAIMINPFSLFNEILLRTAPKLEGPWTEGTVIYSIPDMSTASPHYDKDTFCYAGKEHPEFATTGTLLFTYVCNTFSAEKLETEMDIYYPKAVRMELSKIFPQVEEVKN